MQSKNLFLIGFIRVDQVTNNSAKSGFGLKIRKPKLITKSFETIIEAKQWAQANIDSYIDPKANFLQRDFFVEDYVETGSEGREGQELAEPVNDNLTRNLNPLLQKYCEEFWFDQHDYSFMMKLLGLGHIPEGSAQLLSNEVLSKQSRYIADIFMKDCQKELAQFFKKVSDALLRSQIEHRIILFIKNGFVAESCNSHVEESLSAESD